MSLTCFSYTVLRHGEALERKVLVINNVPFYASSGTSSDNGSIIDPAWRRNIWMPFVGLVTGEHPGRLSKLGEHVRGKMFQQNIDEIFASLCNTMGEKNLEAFLRQLLLEKLQAEPYVQASISSYISTKKILDALKTQLVTRFGTIEALIVSMKISPLAWAKNPLLEGFMKGMLALYPQYAFYDDLDLPLSVKNAIMDGHVVVSATDLMGKDKVACQINRWLLHKMTGETMMPQYCNAKTRSATHAFLAKNGTPATILPPKIPSPTQLASSHSSLFFSVFNIKIRKIRKAFDSKPQCAAIGEQDRSPCK